MVIEIWQIDSDFPGLKFSFCQHIPAEQKGHSLADNIL